VTVRGEKGLVAVALGALLHLAFQATAGWSSVHSMPAPWWLDTPLDRALPVVPESAWVYVSWYPASLALFFTDRTTLRRAYLAYLAAFTVCLGSYAAFPVTIERPELPTHASPSVALLTIVYANDKPVNLLPSFHAAVASVLLTLRPTSRILGLLTAVWVAAVCASCVLIKQHYVLDVIAGVALGRGALYVVDRYRLLSPRSVSGDSQSPARPHRRSPGAHLHSSTIVAPQAAETSARETARTEVR
jgi:membrane-associated phospholipid phosphatase